MRFQAVLLLKQHTRKQVRTDFWEEKKRFPSKSPIACLDDVSTKSLDFLAWLYKIAVSYETSTRLLVWTSTRSHRSDTHHGSARNAWEPLTLVLNSVSGNTEDRHYGCGKYGNAPSNKWMCRNTFYKKRVYEVNAFNQKLFPIVSLRHIHAFNNHIPTSIPF